MIILSKSNPCVKELRALREKKFRRERGMFLVEGEKMVRECIASGIKVSRMIAREDYKGELAPDLVLGADAFNSISEEKTPQPILAEAVLPEFALTPPKGSCLLLDGVSDPANVGAIIRTANAAGFHELYLIGCADPFSPKSVRASMSGVFFVSLMQGTREEVLSALDGVPLIAADMGGENIFTFAPPEQFALCIGNEGSGLSKQVREKASFTVRIPMGEHTESLNAAVSAGILMYELKRTTFI